VLGDVAGIKRGCERMNAGEMYPLLAAMLTSKPYDDIIDTGLEKSSTSSVSSTDGSAVATSEAGGTNVVEQRMVQGYVQQYFMEVRCSAYMHAMIDRVSILCDRVL
jgi:hypothetical protein